MKTFKFVTGDTKSITIHLIVNGRREKVCIEAPVAYGITDNAYYITTNEDIAKALKAHPYFGTQIHLESEVDNTPQVVEEKPEELEFNDASAIIYEETVTSKAKAVAYVQGMFDESFNDTSSADAMKKEAAKRWNVSFVNWK